MTIILKGVDPTTFNLVASIIAEILQLAGAYTLCAFTHWMASIYLRKGNKVPVQALGPLPAGLIDAFNYAQSMKWSWPATVAMFLFISDYSTTIAFAGLGFTQVNQEGPQAPTLNLAKRNQFFPYEAIGDPLLPFTASRLEQLLDAPGTPTLEEAQEIAKLARVETLIDSFLGAADAIAQGRSLFLHQSEELVNDPSQLVIGQTIEGNSIFSGLEDSTILFGTDSVLAGIDLEIPLDCNEQQQEEDNLMTVIQEQRGPENWRVRSHVPNCTFTSLRMSGIYDADDSDGQAEITAYARVGAGADAKLLVRDQYVDDTSTFYFPYEGLQLAKENRDFREGRQVFGLGGVMIGDMEIPFDSTVVSSGRHLVDPPHAIDPEDRNALKSREYLLVSMVRDANANSPKDPSGAEDSTCIVSVKVTCTTFLSEIGFGGFFDIYGPPDRQLEQLCVFNGDIELVWGRNYSVDQQLLAAVAGIQSRNSNWALSSSRQRILSIHSIPAALFMLAELDRRPSTEQVQSTTIDGIFIAFMCAPAGLCLIAGTVYLLGLRLLLPLPDSGGSLLELGAELAEKEKLESRSFCCGNFMSLSFRWDGERLSLNPEEEVVFVQDPSKGSSRSSSSKTSDEIVQIDATKSPETTQIDSLVVDNDDNNNNNNMISEEFKRDTARLGSGFFGIYFEDPPSTRNANSQVMQRDTEQCMVFHQNTSGNCEAPGNLPLHDTDPKRSSEQPEETHNTSSCSSHINGTVIYVIMCMIFCLSVGLVAVILVEAEDVSFQANHAFQVTRPPPQHMQSLSKQKTHQVLPPGCFESSTELRKSMSSYLYGSESTREIIVEQHGHIEDWCLDYVDDFSFLFAGLHEGLIHNASNWNVSNVLDFSFCFYKFDFSENGFDISDWDVSSGLDFSGMFDRAVNFNEDLSKWNVSSGKVFSSMFSRATDFDSDLSEWDVSSATDMSYMFYIARDFNADISNWDVSSVANFTSMFADATRFNGNLSQWDVSSGEKFNSMFMDAPNFNSDLSQWDVSSGKDVGTMFAWATSFNADLSLWNVSSVVNFGWMFRSSEIFNADISLWDVSSGTNFFAMFSSASAFNGNISNWDVSSGINFESMLGAARFNTDISQWDVSSGETFRFMFSGATSFNQDLSEWDVSSASNFFSMFSGASSFNSDLSKWNVSKGSNFARMFLNAQSFNSDISQWDVSSGTDYSTMFSGATSFNSDISLWDVSSGTTFGWMFDGATTFNANISKWDVSSGTNFRSMFKGAKEFDADLAEWDVSSGDVFLDMFNGATSFNANLCSWNNWLKPNIVTTNMYFPPVDHY